MATTTKRRPRRASSPTMGPSPRLTGQRDSFGAGRPLDVSMPQTGAIHEPDVRRAHVMTTGAASAVVKRVIADRPAFHVADRDTSYAAKGAPVRWNAQAETLELIAGHVRAEHATLEIGSGASTVVFAATGANHIAISPYPEEHARVETYCDAIGVSSTNVTFVADTSDRVLPGLSCDDRLDVDGRVRHWRRATRNRLAGVPLLRAARRRARR